MLAPGRCRDAVPDARAGRDIEAKARVSRAQRPIHVLVEEEQLAVEQADAFERRARHQHCRARDSIGRALALELPMIDLAVADHSTAASPARVEAGAREPD